MTNKNGVKGSKWNFYTLILLERFRSKDLWIIGPPCYRCTTLISATPLWFCCKSIFDVIYYIMQCWLHLSLITKLFIRLSCSCTLISNLTLCCLDLKSFVELHKTFMFLIMFMLCELINGGTFFKLWWRHYIVKQYLWFY